MKKFDLELAKQGHPVCTRDGREARIICFDAKGEQPIVSLINNFPSEYTQRNTNNGNYFSDDCGEHGSDLMMKSKTEKRWMYISDYEIERGKTYVTHLYTSPPEKSIDHQIIEFEVEV